MAHNKVTRVSNWTKCSRETGNSFPPSWHNKSVRICRTQHFVRWSELKLRVQELFSMTRAPCCFSPVCSFNWVYSISVEVDLDLKIQTFNRTQWSESKHWQKTKNRLNLTVFIGPVRTGCLLHTLFINTRPTINIYFMASIYLSVCLSIQQNLRKTHLVYTFNYQKEHIFPILSNGKCFCMSNTRACG